MQRTNAPRRHAGGMRGMGAGERARDFSMRPMRTRSVPIPVMMSCCPPPKSFPDFHEAQGSWAHQFPAYRKYCQRG